MVIAVTPDAMRYLIAAVVSGDLAGRALPISTSVTVMGERHSEDGLFDGRSCGILEAAIRLLRRTAL
jgi:hypothetical protein